ncbi:hypothetical protein BDV09DRAFT_163119 [Aspergillus tetrazonus]
MHVKATRTRAPTCSDQELWAGELQMQTCNLQDPAPAESLSRNEVPGTTPYLPYKGLGV